MLSLIDVDRAHGKGIQSNDSKVDAPIFHAMLQNYFYMCLFTF